MSATWITVLGLTGLLAFAVLMLPAAKRLNFPYTVLLAAVGTLLGLIETVIGTTQLFQPVNDFLTALGSFDITAEAVFFIFLPALVFEAALSIDVRRLMDDIGPILSLAILGLLLSSFIIAGALHWTTAFPFLVCLLIGAICSATDPVAVVALFKEMGAPKRLTILVEGESLFNDATAIVLFTILAAMLTEGKSTDFLTSTLIFLKVFFGGVILGYLAGHLLCWLMKLFSELVLVNITLSISTAYLSFIVAEHYFHVSGVMAVVTAALVCGSIGRTLLKPKLWQELEISWEQTGFWANSIIFILVGMAVPRLLTHIDLTMIIGIIVLTLAALFARALITYAFLPLVSRAGIGKRVSLAYKTIMFWGGLRGAVSLALALTIVEHPNLPESYRQFIEVLVTGFVLFTLFVSATTTRFVMSLFQFDKLTPIECILRDRAVSRSLEKVARSLEYSATQISTHKNITQDITHRYQLKSQLLADIEQQRKRVHPEDWVIMGLTILISLERGFYRERFNEGIVPSYIFRLLNAQLDDLSDALKSGGVEAYRNQAQANLGFDWRFKGAEFVNRCCGIQTLLSFRLAERLNVLVLQRGAQEYLDAQQIGTLKLYLDDQAYEQVLPVFTERFEQTQRACDALSGQYPDYTNQLMQQQLTQSALWQEEAEYARLRNEGVITPAVYRSLSEEVAEKIAAIRSLPALDLHLEPEFLIRKLPMLSQCSKAHCESLAKLLTPKLAFPDELIITKGETGDAMYFIANGAVDIELENSHRTLASGDFFGEIALLNQVPRVANVRALGYCSLLELKHRDFQAFLADHQNLKQQIELIGEQRLQALQHPPSTNSAGSLT